MSSTPRRKRQASAKSVVALAGVQNVVPHAAAGALVALRSNVASREIAFADDTDDRPQAATDGGSVARRRAEQEAAVAELAAATAELAGLRRELAESREAMLAAEGALAASRAGRDTSLAE